MILVHPLAEASIPRAPLPARESGSRHVTEPLQLGEHPASTGSKLGMLALRQAPRCADQVRQARLAACDPALVHSVAITDQDTYPVIDQGGKRFFGAAWMHHVKNDPRTGHHPQPVQRV